MFRIISGRKITLLTIALVSLMAYSTINLHSLTGKVSAVASVSEGIQTCFGRVNQSFTAQLLGGNRAYTTSSFLVATEECFGDVIALSEDAFLGDEKAVELMRKINGLASNVRWFHGKMGTVENKASATIPGKRVISGRFTVRSATGTDHTSSSTKSEISSKFSKTEEIKDQVLDKLATLKSDWESHLGWVKQGMAAASLLLSAMIFGLLIGKRAQKIKNNMFEAEALSEIKKEETMDNVQVEGIITRALESHDLPQCANLFGNFCNELYNHTPIANKFVSPITPVMASSGPAQEAPGIKMAIDMLEQVGKEKVEAVVGSSCSVDGVLSSVIDQLASKLFTHGILVDLNIQADVKVTMSEDSLGQVLFQLLSNAINALNDSTKLGHDKRIKVNLKRLGGVAIIEIENFGKGLPIEIIKEQGNIGTVRLAGIGLSICRELIGQVDGQFILSNMQEEETGEILGAQVKVVLNALVEEKQSATTNAVAAANKGQLVSVFKGSKKQLRKQLGVTN
ncbi:MAG: hypothetical protein A2385_10820 [Bdellovibrionales bacterium RIFOXYB1_FULL_39_21]|nr:MAG: hypothetical protein A2385_10820 [Bdellovibrionales bacterium RIFOXYB1_FULL_39_21]OFZ40732.1 MAG: hypothetical protein A2485_16910 [Bdellovibrionales bacterium RIFOXYC12_FULL_39_17]OFZ48154.1 MAG: hypothetical protein A2404_17070 [Bdellovibrionales bacterium RIFOXYC1_FULL_39_130]